MPANRAAAVWVGGLAFAVYAWTAAPALGWLDSAELTAASTTLGVAHPPGHPVPLLVGRALEMLPFGDLALRTAWASALAGALAAAALCVVIRALLAAIGPDRPWLAAAAALAFAVSPAAWAQAVRAEVYAVAGALLLGALALTTQRRLPAAGLLVGLCLGAHHYAAAVFFLPVALVALAGRPPARTLGWTLVLGLLGAAVLAYLPLRAWTDPLINWGDPRTAGRFLWVVSARAFQKSFGGDFAFGEELGETVSAVVMSLTLPGAALALVGLYATARRAPALAAMLAGIVVAGVVARAALGFDFDNPDALGYLVPAVGAGFALAAAGLAALASLWRPVLVLALAWPLLVGASGREASMRGAWGADAWARAVVEDLPPRTLLVTAYNETTFLAWALAAEGARPDVLVYDRHLVRHPGMAASAVRREPELGGVIDAPLATLAGLGRPVAVELDPEPTPGDELLSPWGAVAWLGPPPGSDAARRDQLARLVPAGPPADVRGARRVQTWSAYLAARQLCRLGRHTAGRAAFAHALRYTAGDADLDELRRACGY